MNKFKAAQPAFLSHPFSPSKSIKDLSITQRMAENVFGYDYGIKPKVMAVANGISEC
jgi:hypothetical protein